jgi:hypothetical protein
MAEFVEFRQVLLQISELHLLISQIAHKLQATFPMSPGNPLGLLCAISSPANCPTYPMQFDHSVTVPDTYFSKSFTVG